MWVLLKSEPPNQKSLISKISDVGSMWIYKLTFVQQMVEQECLRWASKGINITYQIRETRGGYKAGALKEGLKRRYVSHCEYVAIFDADFRPEPDYLRRAIPFLVHNPDIALVQARWRFGKLCFSTISFYTLIGYLINVN